MKKLCIVLATLASSALIACPALADTFNFTAAGGGLTASGQFIANSTTTAGEFLITGISGVAGGASIVALLAPGTYTATKANDNLLFFPTSSSPTSTFFDNNGVSFLLSEGTKVNFYLGNGVFASTIGLKTLDSLTVTPAAAVTPEPGSIVLLGTGALSLLGIMRRRLTA